MVCFRSFGGHVLPPEAICDCQSSIADCAYFGYSRLWEQATKLCHGQCYVRLGPEPVIGKRRCWSTIQEGLHLGEIRILHVLRSQTDKGRTAIDRSAITSNSSPAGGNENHIAETDVVAARFRNRHSARFLELGPHAIE